MPALEVFIQIFQNMNSVISLDKICIPCIFKQVLPKVGELAFDTTVLNAKIWNQLSHRE